MNDVLNDRGLGGGDTTEQKFTMNLPVRGNVNGILYVVLLLPVPRTYEHGERCWQF